MSGMDDTEMASVFEAVKNWGRWGEDDEVGALNLITPEVVSDAARLVETGAVISCSLPLPTAPTIEEASPAQHMMIASGDDLGANGIPGYQQAVDFLGIACHGMGITHIDALCHMFVNDAMYNGVGTDQVRSTGATKNSLAGAAKGIVTKGVFLDIPRLRGVAWLDPSDPVRPEELTAAAAEQKVRVTPGTALLVGTGRDARRTAEGMSSPFAGLAGLDASCVPWLRDSDIAVLGSDAISDVLPPNLESRWAFPIHQCAITAIGLHLIDNLNLGGLAEACRDAQRWEFLFTVGALRAERATGCAVNPLAIL